MSSLKESAVGIGLVGGLILTLCGGIASGMLFMGGAFHATYTRNPSTGEVHSIGDASLLPIAVSATVLGVTILIGALVYGLYTSRTETKGPVTRHERVRILSKYLTDGPHHLPTDWDIDSLANPQFYVQLEIPGRGAKEFRTSRALFEQIGEGLTGEAAVQGNWLGEFTYRRYDE
jgi:hypothetical protein